MNNNRRELPKINAAAGAAQASSRKSTSLQPADREGEKKVAPGLVCSNIKMIYRQSHELTEASVCFEGRNKKKKKTQEKRKLWA